MHVSNFRWGVGCHGDFPGVTRGVWGCHHDSPKRAAASWLLLPKPHRTLLCLYIYIYTGIIIVYYTHTSALPMRACPSGPAPGLVGYRSGAISIGPVQDRFWHVGTRPYGHERILDYDKTTLVAFQASLLLGGGICGSGKLALADISTRSTSTEGRELPGCRLWRHWWHRRLSTTASGAVGGDGMAPWRLSVLQCPISLPRIHCM